MMGDKGFLGDKCGGDVVLANARVPRAVLAAAGKYPGPYPGPGDFAALDLELVAGRISRIAPAGAIVDGPPRLALDGAMVLPAFVDMHTHIDKGHIWPRTANPDGTFAAALVGAGGDRQRFWTREDVRARMNFALKCAFAHGTAALRTHLDAILPQDAISLPLFEEIRAEWAGRIALQAVALLSPEMLEDAAVLDRIAAAVRRHGLVLGGFIADFGDTRLYVRRLLAAARRHDLDLDIHVDETANPAAEGLEILAEEVLSSGFKGTVTAGHCCALAQKPPAEAERILDLVARAGIAIVSLPMCNMYLQDRHRAIDGDPASPQLTPHWRGVTLAHEMKRRGIKIAVASDNTRDPFYAYGDLDMLEVWREATRILHLDHPVGDWCHAVAATPASVMELEAGRLGAGAAADLVVTRARNWSELFARPHTDRTVLRAGRPVVTALPDYSELDHLTGVQP